MPKRQFVPVDANAKPWEEFTTERVKQTLYRKFPLADPDTGALFVTNKAFRIDYVDTPPEAGLVLRYS